ncbi:histone-fold-containing protein [Pisolithus croceorrhizus]|nr:histone-fold-containing protein [Pisolithus croceorrhizus]KAI6162748.1 histone-fold-containing protein [Pisolithus thermaeus]
MPRKDTGTGPISAQAQQDLVSEGIENFELPKSLVTKIAKSAIPDNAKLQKETVLSLVKGSTVFINYLAATAHDVALSKQHKSISASDVLKALEMIEFGDLVEKLQEELQIYRDNTKGDKGRRSAATPSSKGKAKERVTSSIPQSAAEELHPGSPVGDDDEVVGGEGDEGEVDDVVEHDEEEELLDTMHIEPEELQRDPTELHEFGGGP